MYLTCLSSVNSPPRCSSFSFPWINCLSGDGAPSTVRIEWQFYVFILSFKTIWRRGMKTRCKPTKPCKPTIGLKTPRNMKALTAGEFCKSLIKTLNYSKSSLTGWVAFFFVSTHILSMRVFRVDFPVIKLPLFGPRTVIINRPTTIFSPP